MSQLPVEGNQEAWDGFCIEIKLGDFYEYLHVLAAILQEGKWRTEALDVIPWLRKNLTQRVKR
jgi:hypothetical protein